MYYVDGKKHKASLKTDSYQLAKAKLAKIELKLARGKDHPLLDTIAVRYQFGYQALENMVKMCYIGRVAIFDN